MEKNGLSLVRDKGKEIPPLVLEAALLHFGAHVSVAYARPDGDGIEILRQNLKDIEHAGGALGFVNELLEETKDNKIVLHFSSQEVDPQPFELITDGKKQPTLVAFLIGDFSEHTDTKGHSTELIEATEYLSPKILELFERADDDIPKLMAKLKEPNITRELSKMGAGDFLNCTMLASNGDILGYCRPKSPPVRYEWGSMSSDLDEHKAEAPKPEPKASLPETKTLSLAERMAAKKAANATPKPSTTEISPGQHQVNNVEPAKGAPLESLADRMKAKKAEGAKVAQALHVVGIPPVFDKAKNRRKWFAQRGATGETNVDFPDWATRTNPILVTLDKLQACHGKQTVEQLTQKYPIATADEIKMYSGSQVSLAKKEEPKVEAAATVVQDLPGVIPAAHKENLRQKFLSKPTIIALVDKKGQSIADPTFLPAMEDKSPLWTEALGLPNIHAADWWRKEQFMEMGSFSLPTVAIAASQYKLLWLKEEGKVLQLQAELAKLKGEPLPGSTAGVEPAQTGQGLSLAERMAAKKKKAA